jgi:predicted 3-demethylubiquinone-9 3-methyltransferase (glyoxalase superfamily)
MKITIQIFLLGLLVVSSLVMTAGSNQLDYAKKKSEMKQELYTFLTFQKNDAEEAMIFYISLFENSRVIDLNRWGKEGPGKEGTIMHATFELNGKKFMCSDSPPVHNWDFTPAVSIFVECKDEEELQRLYSKLSENGQVAMPLDNYGFSQKFGWVVDRFGVSWQLNWR